MKKFPLLLSLLACAPKQQAIEDAQQTGRDVTAAELVPFDLTNPDATFDAVVIVEDGAGSPLSGATLVFAGQTFTSDATGVISVAHVSVRNHTTAQLHKSGFLPRSLLLGYQVAGKSALRIVLARAGATTSFAASAGGSLTHGPMRVQLPPNAFVDGAGAPYSGTVNAAARGVDPVELISVSMTDGLTLRDDFDRDIVPQGLDAAVGSNGAVSMLAPESVFQLDVSNPTGEPLQLAAGSMATISFKLSPLTTYVVGDVVKTYRLDEATQVLREEGTCTVQAASGGGLECVGQAGHLSVWAMTTPTNTTTPSCGNVVPSFIVAEPYQSELSFGGVTYVTPSNVRVHAEGTSMGVSFVPSIKSADGTFFVTAVGSAKIVVTFDAFRFVNDQLVTDHLQISRAIQLMTSDALKDTDLSASIDPPADRFGCPVTYLDIATADAVLAHCDDGTKNGDETAVDCGGSCRKCRNEMACSKNLDCASNLCTSQKLCAPLVHCEVNNGDCSAQATCSGDPGDVSCACNPGYSGDGYACVDVDACVNHPCALGQSCADLPAPALDDNAGRACVDIDECDAEPCLNGGLCTDGVASFVCECQGGYSGTTCTQPPAVDLTGTTGTTTSYGAITMPGVSMAVDVVFGPARVINGVFLMGLSGQTSAVVDLYVGTTLVAGGQNLSIDAVAIGAQVDLASAYTASAGATVRVVVWFTDGSDLTVFTPANFPYTPNSSPPNVVSVSGAFSHPDHLRPITPVTIIPQISLH